ncbi:MAG TPA: sigma-70 family RNA polymerase sigma factor [Acidimicrobiales bacterium]|nr:sigma-70 family RNA polymerase sigma factor [Acidimicrobiales bacterium]
MEAILLPALVAGRGLDRLVAWNLGGIDDALAVALLRLHVGEIRVFHSGTPLLRRPLEWSLNDIRGLPRTPLVTPVDGRPNRWAPAQELMESVLLGPPVDPVDLLVVADPAGAGQPYGQVVRDGHVLFVEPPPPASLPAPELAPAGGDGHLFRKLTAATTATAPAPAAGLAPAGGPEADRFVSLARFDDEARLVESYQTLARSLARRFRNRGERSDDLEQVALLALIRAARRYSPDRGAFGPFATTSILGELKRHFRDRMWTVRVPRPMQELHLAVRAARDELAQSMRASPTIADIARHLGTTDEAVLAAMEAAENFWPVSLDAPRRGGDDRRAGDDPGTDIPVVDAGFDRSLDRRQLREALPALSPTERLVVRRLYFDGCSQRQVAAEIGVSQMQVSRLMTKVLAKLRRTLESA